jgi:hypothetical protein
MFLALFLGSLYFLYSKNVFFPWARATVLTFIIWSIVYAMLIFGHIRLKGFEEIIFAAIGAVIFYFALNPTVQGMLPFSLVPAGSGSGVGLDLVGSAGNIILDSQYLPWLVIGLGAIVIWKAELIERIKEAVL